MTATGRWSQIRAKMGGIRAASRHSEWTYIQFSTTRRKRNNTAPKERRLKRSPTTICDLPQNQLCILSVSCLNRTSIRPGGLPIMIPNLWLATLLARDWQRNMEYAGNRVLLLLWRIGKMGRMDATMKDVIASSLTLSTMPSGTSDTTILITAPLCVSLSPGDRGKSKPFSSLVSLSFISSFCIREQTVLTSFLQQ